MNNEIKPGDFVRLTDPLDNGTIVRIENVDENGFASWLGGSQYCDMEQVSIADGASPIGNDIDGYYFDLSEIITEIERRVNAQTWLNLKKPFKVYPESAVEYWRRRAEKFEAENAINDKLLDKEHNKLLDAQDEIEKLKESDLERQRLKKEVFNIKKQLYCSDDNQKKEHSKFLDALNKYHCELNRRKKAEAKIKELEAELEQGGFNDERNFI